MADGGLSGGFGSAIILGIVEGATEFLPISSTGHLIIVGAWLGEHSAAAKLFDIFIQLGAILAVCWHQRHRLTDMLKSLTSPQATAFRLLVNVGIAFLPAALLGLLAYDFIKAHLFAPQPVAIALMVGGIIILLVERRDRQPRIVEVEEMRPRDALMVGLAQALALIPGVSRAGATIIGAIMWGVGRKAATEFSFLLALPTMLAATLYDLAKNWQLLTPALTGHLAVGFAVSFVSALIVIRALLHFISRHSFAVFGWYRLLFGAMILLVPALFVVGS